MISLHLGFYGEKCYETIYLYTVYQCIADVASSSDKYTVSFPYFHSPSPDTRTRTHTHIFATCIHTVLHLPWHS